MEDKGKQPGNVIKPGSNQGETSWQFQPDEAQPDQTTTQAPPAPNTSQDDSVSWSASEFISHDKSAGWYGLLTSGAIVLAAGIFFLTKDKISSSVIVIVAIAFGIFAARKPRELTYSVDDQGVHIGEKFYSYNAFRSFSVVQEEAVESIWFSPLKRFMPMISIYFDPADGEKIVDVLSQYLPLENHQLDSVDRLMHRLRF